MLDEKGNLLIIDAILALILILIAVFVINTVMSIPDPTYSENVRDFKNAQDYMTILSDGVNFTDRTFIGDISKILSDGKNSKDSIREVSDISKNKLDSLGLKNYQFSETNVLDNKILASSGDYNSAGNVSVAGRSYGDYFYTLSVW